MSDEAQDSEVEFDFESAAGEDQDAGGDAGDAGAAESASDDQAAAADDKDKRISDLMSKWQKAEARLAKLEKERQEATAQGQQGPSDVQAFLNHMRETARDQVFKSDPRFSRLGLDPALIEGDSPEQMRASADRLVKILDQVESDAESRALKKHGISPDLQGGQAAKLPDFGTMTDEQFETYVQKAKGLA